jgi:hypothetical protein
MKRYFLLPKTCAWFIAAGTGFFLTSCNSLSDCNDAQNLKEFAAVNELNANSAFNAARAKASNANRSDCLLPPPQYVNLESAALDAARFRLNH